RVPAPPFPLPHPPRRLHARLPQGGALPHLHLAGHVGMVRGRIRAVLRARGGGEGATHEGRGMIVAAAPSLPAIEAAARPPAGPGRFLLHSGSDADGLGGASFCGAFPARVLRAGVDDLADPFGAATALGGFSVGYFGYDLGRRVERLPRRDLVGDALWLP